MNDRKFTITKNLLDLEHNENLAKSMALISIGTGGMLGIILIFKQRDLLLGILIAAVFSSIFLFSGMFKLKSCGEIRARIKGLRKEFLS